MDQKIPVGRTKLDEEVKKIQLSVYVEQGMITELGGKPACIAICKEALKKAQRSKKWKDSQIKNKKKK